MLRLLSISCRILRLSSPESWDPRRSLQESDTKSSNNSLQNPKRILNIILSESWISAKSWTYSLQNPGQILCRIFRGLFTESREKNAERILYSMSNPEIIISRILRPLPLLKRRAPKQIEMNSLYNPEWIFLKLVNLHRILYRILRGSSTEYWVNFESAKSRADSLQSPRQILYRIQDNFFAKSWQDSSQNNGRTICWSL